MTTSHSSSSGSGSLSRISIGRIYSHEKIRWPWRISNALLQRSKDTSHNIPIMHAVVGFWNSFGLCLGIVIAIVISSRRCTSHRFPSTSPLSAYRSIKKAIIMCMSLELFMEASSSSKRQQMSSNVDSNTLSPIDVSA